MGYKAAALAGLVVGTGIGLAATYSLRNGAKMQEEPLYLGEMPEMPEGFVATGEKTSAMRNAGLRASYPLPFE